MLKLPTWFLLSVGLALWSYDILCADIHMSFWKANFKVNMMEWLSRQEELPKNSFSWVGKKRFYDRWRSCLCVPSLICSQTHPKDFCLGELEAELIPYPILCLLHLSKKVPGWFSIIGKELRGPGSLQGPSSPGTHFKWIKPGKGWWETSWLKN